MPHLIPNLPRSFLDTSEMTTPALRALERRKPLFYRLFPRPLSPKGVRGSKPKCCGSSHRPVGTRQQPGFLTLLGLLNGRTARLVGMGKESRTVIQHSERLACHVVTLGLLPPSAPLSGTAFCLPLSAYPSCPLPTSSPDTGGGTLPCMDAFFCSTLSRAPSSTSSESSRRLSAV